MHCSIVKKNYQQASKVIFTFVRQFISIAPQTLIILNTINTEF